MRVREAISNEAVWIAPSETIADAAYLMDVTGCAFVPVIENHRAIGVVTDRDIAMALAIGGYKPYATAVVKIMTPNPHSVEADAPLEQAATEIVAKGVHRLVVEKDGQFVGVISMADLAGLIPASSVTHALRVLADHDNNHSSVCKEHNPALQHAG